MYTAKVAGGNHIMVYQPDRDGQPGPDGTRPLIRRRDLNPPGPDGLIWQPTPGDDLPPLLLSLDEARTVHQAVCTARDRWANSRAEAQARSHNDARTDNDQAAPATTAQQTAQQISADHVSAEQTNVERVNVERVNVEPAPAGYRAVARLADRIAPIIEGAEIGDSSTSARSA